MRAITAEWVAKAEDDFALAERELRVRKHPAYDAVCFHAQQCAEKYLKARLPEANRSFAKIHALVPLLEQVLPLEPTWEMFREDLARLSVFAVAFRYPGMSADREIAKDVVKRCRRFRKAARSGLRLK